jgi:hypothetical protein
MAKAKKQELIQEKEKAQPVKKAAPRVKAAKHRTAASTVVIPSETTQLIPQAHETIAAVAYSYWESRGYQGGDALEDWFRAESELRQQTMAATA